MVKLSNITIILSLLAAGISNAAMAAALATATVTQSNQEQAFTVEGVVEAVKNSLVAPQVTGDITYMPVKAGDYVKAGQLLARIDTRMANQQAMTNQAQVAAAQAQLSAAKQEFERKRRLHEKQYISQAALERAESDYKTAQAQTKAQLAQSGIANVQTGLHTINAPYAGIVAEVMIEQGDMAMPGSPLVSMYDPKALRVLVNVPQSQLSNIKSSTNANGANVKVQIPAATEAEQHLVATQISVLPTADIVSNMIKVRLSLPQGLVSVSPGMFARAVLPSNNPDKQTQLVVPVKAVIKRSELTAVYVVDPQGNPQLRQVRLGRPQGDNVEVFAGLHAGEKVALDPIAAANFKTKKHSKK